MRRVKTLLKSNAPTFYHRKNDSKTTRNNYISTVENYSINNNIISA